MRFGSPQIVTDGLVLYLDAANPSSYPGTGTTWTDLSGNNNTGTLTNGPSFNGSNGGSIVFDGSTQYGTVPDFSMGSTLTVDAWVKTSSSSVMEIFCRGTNGDTSGMLFAFVSGQLYGGGNSGSGWNSSALYTPTLNDNKWHYVAGVFNQTVNQIIGYVDGILGNTVTSTFLLGGYTPTNSRIGRNQNGSTQFWNGNISIMRIYNRLVSTAEILQNYNATKGRFNL